MTKADTSQARPLPPVPRLSPTVFGATAIFTALAIGSGEIMFWPALVLSNGAGVLWIAIAAVALQWLVNVEIARYSLATGESMVVGVARRAPWLGVVLLLGATIPWIWPGWIRSGAQLAAAVLHEHEPYVSAAMLASCTLILSLPNRVYALVEFLQSVMLLGILLGVVALFAIVASSQGGIDQFVAAFLNFDGAQRSLTDLAGKEDTAYFALLGGVVFAGAGGILNIGYGLLICEKGFGMGAYSPKVTGLLRSGGLDSDDGPLELEDSSSNRATWRQWLRLVRAEHLILFFGGNVASIIFLSAIFFMLFAGVDSGASGVSLLVSVFERMGTIYGQPVAVLFATVGVLVFYTSALGILDFTSRIAASILRTLIGQGGPTVSTWFHIAVWVQTASAAALIFIDPRQPFWLLVTSAVLNTLVMAVYAWAIVWLNHVSLPAFARAPMLIGAALIAAGALYASIFAFTLSKLW